MRRLAQGRPGGFTLILDDTTLAIPDRPGNRRVDGFRNVLAKAFKRSGLWRPEGWADPAALPSNARIVKDTMDIPETLAELEEYYGPEYDKRLY